PGDAARGHAPRPGRRGHDPRAGERRAVVRAVLRYPHPSLKRIARPLDDDLGEAARVAGDLVDTMRSFPGRVGIAAPPIDELARVIVVDVSEHPKAPESA